MLEVYSVGGLGGFGFDGLQVAVKGSVTRTADMRATWWA